MKTTHFPRCFAIAVLISLQSAFAVEAQDLTKDRPSVIVAVGAPGEDVYADTFPGWAEHWKKSETAGAARVTLIGNEPDKINDLARLRAAVETEAKTSPAPLWIVLLGHGAFDGREGKFNLRGDDLAASELAKLLAPVQRPVVVICGFSASGAFLKPLSAPDRVVVTATRSGAENNFARFGGYFSEAITDPAADLDKDGQTSVLEAWLSADQRVNDFYQSESRLATEHALLDDNGDGFGTPPNWFSGVRLIKKSADQRAPDGLRAHQLYLLPSAAERTLSATARMERDRLERELSALRDAKASMVEEEYLEKLEALLLQLARVYRDQAGPGGS